MNEAINYVLTRMAAERGITMDQMQDIIEEAMHTSSDPVLRDQLMARLGNKDPSAREFIGVIAGMIDTAHLDV